MKNGEKIYSFKNKTSYVIGSSVCYFRNPPFQLVKLDETWISTIFPIFINLLPQLSAKYEALFNESKLLYQLATADN